MRSQESGAGKCHHHNQTMKTPVYITVLDYFYKKKLNNILFCSLREKWGSEGGGGGEGTCNKLVFCFFRFFVNIQ